MTTLKDMTANGRMEQHRPWPRVLLDVEDWRVAGGQLVAGQWTLLGLWGDIGAVHMAVLGESTDEAAVLSLACPNGTFPSIGAFTLQRSASSARLPISSGLNLTERRTRGLGSISASGMCGTRSPQADRRWYIRFIPSFRSKADLHQISVGPVHAGIIEPGHFRFTANGETVVRLEQRLGYAHKGIEGLIAGATLDSAARLAGRTSGDSTVAYGLAFAHAIEAALQIKAPPRAIYLRALMAELERLANHLGDFGAICNDASFSLMHAQCYVLREQNLRASNTCFGHRLMMDCVVPGGIAHDLGLGGAEAVTALVRAVRRIFPALVELYDNTASLQDRTVTTGILRTDLAKQFGAGGYVGRASGRSFDVRKDFPYPPYDHLEFRVPVREAGDVDARVRLRIDEIEQSLLLIDQILRRLPDGSIRTPVNPLADERAEGIGFVEGFRGDVLVWLRLDGDRVARCHLRDPSWFQWPLLEAVIEGNIVADFPLCNKSFNCSYSGHDL